MIQACAQNWIFRFSPPLPGFFTMELGIIDAIGMLGTLLIVLAYYLLQLERTDPKSLSYNIINLTGAALLLFSLCFNFNLASFVIEVFWICASLIGLWKYWRRQGSASQSAN
jgi:predicted membrane protein